MKFYTTLLYLCDGADKGNWRCYIAEKLLERRADVEARDQRGNTPFLLASACGFTSMLKILLERGNANKLAVNIAGDGAIARALQSSGTTKNDLRLCGVYRRRYVI